MIGGGQVKKERKRKLDPVLSIARSDSSHRMNARAYALDRHLSLAA